MLLVPYSCDAVLEDFFMAPASTPCLASIRKAEYIYTCHK